MKYPIVLVHWVDVQSIDTALVFPEELDYEPVLASLVGFLVKETRGCYFLAKEVWETGQCKYLHIVPKKFVEDIYPLSEVGAKKRR